MIFVDVNVFIFDCIDHMYDRITLYLFILTLQYHYIEVPIDHSAPPAVTVTLDEHGLVTIWPRLANDSSVVPNWFPLCLKENHTPVKHMVGHINIRAHQSIMNWLPISKEYMYY